MPLLEPGEADRLAVTVLVDDSVAQPDLVGRHGLSLWAEVTAGDTVSRFLIDTGPAADILGENMARLEIDGSTVDAVVLTHCHYDHTGGLVGLVGQTGRRGLPVLAHPAVFRPNFSTRPRLRHVGMDTADAQALARAGARLLLTRDPLPLMEGVTTTGEVPRVSGFEDPGHPGWWTIQDGRLLPDPMTDDISLVVILKGRGLVVLTGCSHAGIINILKYAISLTGVSQVHAVLGGFHLTGARPERIEHTVSELLALAPLTVAPGHCTGTEAQFRLKQALGNRFKPLGAGARFHF